VPSARSVRLGDLRVPLILLAVDVGCPRVHLRRESAFIAAQRLFASRSAAQFRQASTCSDTVMSTPPSDGRAPRQKGPDTGLAIGPTPRSSPSSGCQGGPGDAGSPEMDGAGV